MPGDNNKGAFVVTSTQNHQIIHLYHEQILFWYQKRIRRKTASTFIYKTNAISLTNILLTQLLFII